MPPQPHRGGLYVLLPFWPNSPCDTKHLYSLMLKTAIKKCKPSTIIPSASITNGDETNSFSNPSESSLLLSPSSVLSPNIPWPTSGFRWRQFTLRWLHERLQSGAVAVIVSTVWGLSYWSCLYVKKTVKHSRTKRREVRKEWEASVAQRNQEVTCAARSLGFLTWPAGDKVNCSLSVCVTDLEQQHV